MMSANNLLAAFAEAKSAGDAGFTAVVAFDFYDGPERGLAMFPTGDGVRFASLGDSKSRLFRAYEFTSMEGTWSSQVEALKEAIRSKVPIATHFEPPRRVWVPEASARVAQLDHDVFEAPATGQFIGVGSPYLDRISVCPVASDQLAHLRGLKSSPAGFQFAHRLVKQWTSRNRIVRDAQLK